MASLLDIAPASDKVTIRGGDVEVFGVSAKGVAHLLAKFPELGSLMVGREVSPDKLMAMGGDIVSAIIAAGCGHPGSDEYEARANALNIEEQADLVAAILKLTMPGGLAPFVDKLTGVLGGVGLGLSGAAQDTKSQKPSPT